LNSFEYGAIFGINRHPSRPSKLSRQMSTKPGELQLANRTQLATWTGERIQ